MSENKAIKTYTAELFLKEKHTLGESPFYDARTKTISWVDIASLLFMMPAQRLFPGLIFRRENSLLSARMETSVLFLTDRKSALQFQLKNLALTLLPELMVFISKMLMAQSLYLSKIFLNITRPGSVQMM